MKPTQPDDRLLNGLNAMQPDNSYLRGASLRTVMGRTDENIVTAVPSQVLARSISKAADSTQEGRPPQLCLGRRKPAHPCFREQRVCNRAPGGVCLRRPAPPHTENLDPGRRPAPPRAEHAAAAHMECYIYDGWNPVAKRREATAPPVPPASSPTYEYTWQACVWSPVPSGSLQGAGGVGRLIMVSDPSARPAASIDEPAPPDSYPTGQVQPH